MMLIGDKQKADFEARFIKLGCGCWQWLGACDGGGYGRFIYRQEAHAAHRFSYRLYIGEIPDDLCILHRCDNPGCVNPEHHRLGTHSHNMQDKTTKGRCKLSPTIELTDAEKVAILALCRQGKSYTSVGKFYGVSAARILGITKSKRIQALAP